MLSSISTPRHICSSCLRKRLLPSQVERYRSKSTSSSSKHRGRARGIDQAVNQSQPAPLGHWTLSAKDEATAASKEKGVIHRRWGGRQPVIGPSAKKAGQIHSKHNNIRTSKPSLTRPDPQDATPEEFLRVLDNAVSDLRQVRNLKWFRLRVGFDGNNAQHRAAADDWFDRVEHLVKLWGKPETRKLKKSEAPLYNRLFKAWTDGGVFKLNAELRFSIAGHIVHHDSSPADIARQAEVADVRYPAEWFPQTRQISREIHLHIGPTNSGKTYHALQRLIQARSGLYAGPLRLLAHEVYGRLINAGRSCHLITGDERIISDDAQCMMSSSTVEMAPSGVMLDVAVIDEIQMLGDLERGWAWTNAFLGLRAAEIHLCGEARSLPLVRALAASTGEKVIVHEYKRLSPLAVADEGLGGDLSKIQPGDCLVAFSRARIHKYAVELGKHVEGKVAVIYGSLPPDTRAKQAQLFNDPDSGYDTIVASNAIGMGLNLNIRRIIFSEISKFNGSFTARLAETDIKQIGGRAGRFRVAPSLPSGPPRLDAQNPESPAKSEASPTHGVVTTLWDEDLDFVRAQMDREPRPLKAAGLKVPDKVVMRFAAYFPPETPLSYIMLRLKEVAKTTDLYRLCEEDEVLIADAIQIITGLKIEDRLTICASPADPADDLVRDVLLDLTRCVSTDSDGDLLSITSIPLYVLDDPVLADLKSLGRLERLHKALTLYIWLAFRFDSVFVSGALASHARSITENKITETLAALAETGKTTVRKGPRIDPNILRIDGDERADEDSATTGSRFHLGDIASDEEQTAEESLPEDGLRGLIEDGQESRTPRPPWGHDLEVAGAVDDGRDEMEADGTRVTDAPGEPRFQQPRQYTPPPLWGHEDQVTDAGNDDGAEIEEDDTQVVDSGNEEMSPDAQLSPQTLWGHASPEPDTNNDESIGQVPQPPEVENSRVADRDDDETIQKSRQETTKPLWGYEA